MFTATTVTSGSSVRPKGAMPSLSAWPMVRACGLKSRRAMRSPLRRKNAAHRANARAWAITVAAAAPAVPACSSTTNSQSKATFTRPESTETPMA